MSIRILRDVNGAFGDFATHDIVMGLSPVQEAQLISNNEAEEVLTQIGLLSEDNAKAVVRLLASDYTPSTAVSYASQFVLNRRALPIRSVVVSASGLVKIGPCAVAGFRCVTPGSSGTFAINDDVDAATAAQIRETRAYTAATANTYYPMALDDQAAMLMGYGCYVTVPTGGVYVLDLIDDLAALPGIEGQGMLLEPVRVAATGLALWDAPAIASVKVIAPGSAGTLTIHDATANSDATRLRLSIAFGSLTAGQIIPLGGKGAAPTFGCAYVTITTGGIFLLNRYPG